MSFIYKESGPFLKQHALVSFVKINLKDINFRMKNNRDLKRIRKLNVNI